LEIRDFSKSGACLQADRPVASLDTGQVVSCTLRPMGLPIGPMLDSPASERLHTTVHVAKVA
jgi:hypothetical protein